MGKPLDARSDMYSFGLVLSECLTGLRVFPGSMSDRLKLLHAPPPRPGAVANNIPPEMDQVVQRMLAPDPKDRFPDTTSAWDALKDALIAMPHATD